MGCRIAAVLCALGVWLFWSAPRAAAQQPGEYAVKAAFLYNFAKFVEWPVQAFPSPDAPFSMCVLGPDPFGGALDTAVANERIQGRPLVVRRLDVWDASARCHILFVSSALQTQFAALLGAGTFSRTLTVGDGDAFLQAGGHISFFLEENRVRFAINAESVARSDLQISSKLMRVARVDRRPGSTP
jgi:YfiR/HmsC-like